MGACIATVRNASRVRCLINPGLTMTFVCRRQVPEPFR